MAEAHLDLDRLWPLLTAQAPYSGNGCVDPIAAALVEEQSRLGSPCSGNGCPPVVVAQDAAFHFIYPETFELLTALGLEVQPWSPLADQPLPRPCGAVVLPGGYPELYAAELAAASLSRASLAEACRQATPMVAECGGLLLLGDTLEDLQGRPWPMAGVLPFSARKGGLSLGYRQAQALGDGLLVREQERFIGHEFHRWQLLPSQGQPKDGALWQLEGWGLERSLEGWTTSTLHASWLHLHWAGFPRIPLRLAAAIAGAGRLPPSAAFCNPKTPPKRPFQSAGV